MLDIHGNKVEVGDPIYIIDAAIGGSKSKRLLLGVVTEVSKSKCLVLVHGNQKTYSKTSSTIVKPKEALVIPEEDPYKQVGGNHYRMKIQPLDYIEANKLTFSEGNVIKYVSRHRNKNGLEDLFKAKHYLERIIAEYEED